MSGSLAYIYQSTVFNGDFFVQMSDDINSLPCPCSLDISLHPTHTQKRIQHLHQQQTNITLFNSKTQHFRSAAYIKMGQFSKAYQDAVKAKELNAEWPKVS